MFSKNNNKIIKKINSLLPKIFSVVAAVVLWIYVVNVENTTEEIRIHDIPIVFENFNSGENDGLTIVSSMDNTVSIDLKGSASALEDLNPDEIKAFVDLSDVDKADTYELKVNIGNIPKGVSVVGKSPGILDVKVDKSEEKQVDVIVHLVDYSVESGYEFIKEPEADVKKIVVSGPSHLVDKVSVGKIVYSAGNINGSRKLNNVAISLYDKNDNVISAPNLKLSSKTANVEISVKKVIDKKDVFLPPSELVPSEQPDQTDPGDDMQSDAEQDNVNNKNDDDK